MVSRPKTLSLPYPKQIWNMQVDMCFANPEYIVKVGKAPAAVYRAVVTVVAAVVAVVAVVGRCGRCGRCGGGLCCAVVVVVACVRVCVCMQAGVCAVRCAPWS